MLDASDQILRLPEVMKITGLSRSTIYSKMDDGTFPKTVQLSTRAVGWPVRSIKIWLEEKMPKPDPSEIPN